MFLISRYYDSASGQFLSVDPLVSQTMEPYEYAGENPMAHTDPSGQSAYGCIGLDPQNGFTLCFGIDGSGQTVLQMSVYVFDRSQYYQGTQYFFAALAITGARHKILTVDKVELKSAYIIWMPEEWELFIIDFIPYHVFAPGQYCGVWVGPPPNNTRIGNEKNGACESVET